MTPPPLILFSGLGADAAVFAPQRDAFPHLLVPEWIAPHRDEFLAAYCERFADQIRPPTPPILGGASFGGVIALEMAKFLKPRAIVLIGSVRDPRHLPRRVRWLRGATPFVPVRLLQGLCGLLTPIRRLAPHLRELARQFHDADSRVVRWSMRQITNWTHVPEVDCPVHQIHGGRDFILPAVRDGSVTLIPNGGHVISLTHAAEVNAFLRDIISRS